MVKIVFDGFALIIIGFLVVAYLIFIIATEWRGFVYHLFKAQAWAKVYCKYPDMLLDRKYAVKYKKHLWNKYKIYHDDNRKYDNDYLYYEASAIVNNIQTGKIKI